MFNNIKDFLNIKSKCSFCQTILTPIFTNFTGLYNYIPLIVSKLNDNYFNFNLNYISCSMSVNVDINLNIINNELIYSPISYPINQIIDVFESINPHVELVCCNKFCSMNYYICSNILSCKRSNSSNLKIRPLSLGWECCNVGKFWIQNVNNNTNIYSTINENLNPIKVDFIDFNLFGKDKLENRIKTIIAFS
jgi:hypothetical protein